MQIDICKENHMLKADLRKVQYDRDILLCFLLSFLLVLDYGNESWLQSKEIKGT